MKQLNRLILPFLFLFYTLDVTSQNEIGLRSGMSFAKFKKQSLMPKINTIRGVDSGIVWKKGLRKNIFLGIDMGFIQKGGEVDFGFRKSFVKTNQIELGTALGIDKIFKKIVFSIEVGSFYGYVVNEAKNIDALENSLLSKKDNDFDIGIVAKGKIGRKFKNSTISIIGGYKHSISKYRISSYGDLLEDPEFSILYISRVLSLGFLYSIDL